MMRPSRRSFVLFALRAFVLQCLPYSHALEQVQPYSQCHKTRAVILGAGMAGITAAHALSNASVSDFLIVEHQGDIGGRVSHTSFGSSANNGPYTIELGANWVQGTVLPDGTENPIWFLAKKYGLNMTFSDYNSILTYTEAGYSNYSYLFHEFTRAQTEYILKPDYVLAANLKDLTTRSALSYVGWHSAFDPQKQAVEWAAYDYEYASTPEVSTAAFDVAGYSLSGDRYKGGYHFVHDQRGFNIMIKGEASEFLNCTSSFDCSSDPRLRLNTTVLRIDRDDTGVTVHTDDGSCIRAEQAICTFSLGVLQHGDVAFAPPLPAQTRLGIATLTMATYTKIFLQFPADAVFWDAQTQFFLYADPIQRGYFPIFQSLEGETFLPGSGILFVTVVQDQSYAVEAQDTDTTKEQVLAVLRDMFGADRVPEPLAFLYPRWSLQPWSYGSYSNWPAGIRKEQAQDLRRRLGPLWFAGEATSIDYFGLLQGAYVEGKRVGELVAKLVK